MFIALLVERKKADLLSTRALITALTPSDKKADPIVEAYQSYVEAIFPFLDSAKDKERDKQRNQLKEFAKTNARINMSDMFKQQAEKARQIMRLKSFRKSLRRTH